HMHGLALARCEEQHLRVDGCKRNKLLRRHLPGDGTVGAASRGDVTKDDTGPGSSQWLTHVDIAEVAHALRQRMGREATCRVYEDESHARIVSAARGGGVGNRGAQSI